MIRVHVLVEGQTEEGYVKEVLWDHFNIRKIYLIPRQLGKPGHKGGVGEYPRARKDILNTLKEDKSSFCTTMFDYYGMPHSWPGRRAACCKPFIEKPKTVEEALHDDIVSSMGKNFYRNRFVPYVQMHEFEALLFSDPKRLAEGLNLDDSSDIDDILNSFQGPEEINDHPDTAPSKRISKLMPGYEKSINGILISLDIDMETMRKKCPHFNAWIECLEKLTSF